MSDVNKALTQLANAERKAKDRAETAKSNIDSIAVFLEGFAKRLREEPENIFLDKKTAVGDLTLLGRFRNLEEWLDEFRVADQQVRRLNMSKK